MTMLKLRNLQVTDTREKTDVENAEQLLDRVMTVAELLAKSSIEKSTDIQPKCDKKPQDQEAVVK